VPKGHQGGRLGAKAQARRHPLIPFLFECLVRGIKKKNLKKGSQR
jgi:hypothetical protein